MAGGIFDTISDALSGKSTPAAPSKPLNKTGGGDFSDLMAARNREMARMGMNPDGSPIPHTDHTPAPVHTTPPKLRGAH